jgi:hypothetical protein
LKNIHLTKEAVIDLAQEPGTTFRRLLDELKEWDFTPGRYPVKMSNTVWKFRLGKKPRVLVLRGKYQDEPSCLVSEIYSHDAAIDKAKHFGKINIHSGEVWTPVSSEDMSQEVDYDLAQSGLFTVPYEDKAQYNINELDLKPFFAEDQIKAIQAPGPLLLNGGAGSGKTLCLLERLMMSPDDGQKTYITLDGRISKEIGLWATQINNKYQEIHFTSIIEYYAHINKRFGDLRKFIHFRKFKEYWGLHRGPFTAEITWEEIRGILKGYASYQARDTTSNLLKYDIYISLRKDESLIPKMDRPELYKFAEKYSDWLEKNEYWDNQDLALNRVQMLRQDVQTPSCAIAIDEVQDFTSLELEAILLSLSNIRNFSCAGDINQKVYRTNFRWEYLQKFVKEHGQLSYSPKVLPLRLNLRNSKSVVNVANLLLQEIKILLRNLGSKVAVISQKAMSEVEGMVKYVIIDDIEEYIDAIFVSPTRFTILQESINLENFGLFRFNVENAKGLEQDTVILVGFWSWLNEVERKNDSSKLHVLRQLLIACTRAKQNLYFIENENHSIFQECGFMQEAEPDELTKEENISPEQWEQAALYYQSHRKSAEEKSAWKHAAESWTKINSHRNAAKSWLKIDEDFEAALSYEEGGDLDEAQTIFEKLKMYDRVAPIWVAMEVEDAFDLCVGESEEPVIKDDEYYSHLAHAFDCLEKFEEASDAWKTSGNLRNAATSFMNAKLFEPALDIWMQIEDFDQASQCQVNLGKHIEAAELFEKAGNLEMAALQYEKADNFEAAAKMWVRIENNTKAAKCFEKLGKYDEAAEYWEQGVIMSLKQKHLSMQDNSNLQPRCGKEL